MTQTEPDKTVIVVIACVAIALMLAITGIAEMAVAALRARLPNHLGKWRPCSGGVVDKDMSQL
jgi:hypothetical protein